MAIDVQHAVEDDEAELNVTINTTPLVDVMLVMLIIFLVTIPVILKTVNLQLPTYRNIVTQTKPENIVIAVTSDETTYYNNVPVDAPTMLNNFVTALKTAAAANKPLPEVILDAAAYFTPQYFHLTDRQIAVLQGLRRPPQTFAEK